MMPRVSVNRILFGALLVLAVGGWTFGGDTSKPNYEILPGMLYSIPYDAFAGNPNFPDGKTLQPPVRGTIARGQLPLNFEATPEDALRAGDELQGPIAADDTEALRRGSRAYVSFCLPCHGPTGKGDGLVPKRGFPPPPTFFRDETRNMKDGQLFHIITYGQGNMPPYAVQVTQDDRWKIIAYIRSLQANDAAAADREGNE